uniref:Uncharacterized protein n=1 Tax=Lepeophtheirus salmonis TaxID=72036 RepID=A0A0K2TUV0_LEPSM
MTKPNCCTSSPSKFLGSRVKSNTIYDSNPYKGNASCES